MENIIFTLVERGLGFNLIRSIFATLDSMIFTLWSWTFELVYNISTVTSNKNLTGFYDGFQGRIYLILSIYMLFKITVSLITYVVNPDSMTDKSQGAGKLVTRIMISLVLLIAINPVLNTLYDLESDIIKDNTIGNIILGGETVSGSTTDADKIGVDIYNGLAIREGKNKVSGTYSSVSELVEHVNDSVTESRKDVYKYTYYPVLGFAVGLIMSLLMISICIDLAMRVFKLIILQLVAPIPILSYIDPKSSKDSALSKWFKLYIQVWTELFIKLVVIDFILLAIKKLITEGIVFEIAKDSGVLVTIVLVIGLLFFAKNAPKFICEAIGIKPPERGLFAGLGEIAGAGAIGLGAIGAGVAAGRANYMADEALGKEHNIGRYLKNVGAGLFGGASGIVAGAGAAVSAKDHNARAVNEALAKRNQLALRRGAAGSTGLGRARESLSQMFTGQTAFDRRKKEVEALDSMVKNTSAFQNNLKSEASKGKYGQIKIDGKGGYMGDQKLTGNSKILRSEGQLALSNGDEWFYHDNGDGTTSKVSTKEFERIAGDMEKAEMQSLYELFQNGDTSTIENNPDLYAEYQTVVEEANALGFDTTTSKSLDDSKKQAQADSYNTKATREYKAGQANSNEVKK